MHLKNLKVIGERRRELKNIMAYRHVKVIITCEQRKLLKIAGSKFYFGLTYNSLNHNFRKFMIISPTRV